MEGAQGHKDSCHGRCTRSQRLLSRKVHKVTRTPVTDGEQGLLSWKVHRRGIFNWHKVKGVIRTDKQCFFLVLNLKLFLWTVPT